MRYLPRFAVIATLSLLCLCVTAGPSKPAASASVGARIAVIDINKVLNSWNQATTEEVKLKTQVEEFEGQHKQRVEEMKRMDQASKLLEGKAKEEKEKELASRKREYEAFKSVHLKKIFEAQRDLQVRWYQRINQTAADLAKEEGFDLILVSDDAPSLGNAQDLEEDFMNFKRAVNLRKVLYARDDIDLTQKVIDRLNAESGKPK